MYTHEITELGNLERQARLLNNAQKVHFMCSLDRDRLVSAGLEPNRARVVLGAVDNDCFKVTGIKREPKSVLLSSRFGPRKGFEFLPEIVEALPDWNFTILGVGWDAFLRDSGLHLKQNIESLPWETKSRRDLMTANTIFLSLSSLEGGPIPLLDALACGMYSIATDTGFARDIIRNGENGKILEFPLSNEQIVRAILDSNPNEIKSMESVKALTWDALAGMYLQDTQ